MRSILFFAASGRRGSPEQFHLMHKQETTGETDE
jgi:hypothetical protein